MTSDPLKPQPPVYQANANPLFQSKPFALKMDEIDRVTYKKLIVITIGLPGRGKTFIV
jgi:hypothetical protein